MKALLVFPLTVALSGCTVNALTPIAANTQVQTSPAGGVQGTGTVKPGNLTPAGEVPQPLTSPTSKAPGLRFSMVRKFSNAAVAQVIDYENVVVAEGTDVYRTSDAGKSWTKSSEVGSQPIASMFWKDSNNGWLGAGKGTLIHITGDKMEVLDAKTTYKVKGVYFVDEKRGYLADSNNAVWGTTDGGVTWEKAFDAVDPAGGWPGIHTFYPDGKGNAYYVWSQEDNSAQAIYLLETGAVTKVSHDRKVGRFANGRVFLSQCNYYCEGSSTGTWTYLDDTVQVGTFGPAVKTPSQIIKDNLLLNIFPVDENNLVGQLKSGSIVFSQNAGQVWTDPVAGAAEFVWLKPFSFEKMWGWSDNTLYRSGT